MTELLEIFTLENIFIAFPLLIGFLKYTFVYRRRFFKSIKFYFALQGIVVFVALSAEIIKMSLVGVYMLIELLFSFRVNPNPIIYFTTTLVYALLTQMIMERWAKFPQDPFKSDLLVAAYNLMIPWVVGVIFFFVSVVLYFLVFLLIY